MVNSCKTTANYFLLYFPWLPFFVKTIFFAFIISSVSAYFGYNTKGGAINVGKASTKAVVVSSIIILILNYILTDLLLSWLR